MATQTTPYADVVSGVEALAGDSFGTVELARLKANINRRARLAYRLYDYWPEFIVTKQQRMVRGDGGIEAEPTDFNGDATGEDIIESFYRIWEDEPFDENTVPGFGFHVQGDKAYPVGYDRTYAEHVEDASLGVTVVDIAGRRFLLVSGTTPHGLKVGDYFKILGMDQTGGDTYDLDTPNVVLSVSSVTAFSAEISATVGAGASYVPTNPNSDSTADYPAIWTPRAWFSGRKRLTATYGDGAGETTTVPRRWADYLIQGAYTDFLRADGQTEKAQAEELIAQEIIEREIYDLDKHQSLQAVSTEISTHGTAANR